MRISEIKQFLDSQLSFIESQAFIEPDPVSIPHQFRKKEDIEISAFLTATIAWGNRKIILKNANDLMNRMDYEPHSFILHHSASDIKRLANFKHRTFNFTDLHFFIKSLKNIYLHYDGMEEIFSLLKGPFQSGASKEFIYDEWNAQTAILNFRKVFFSLPHQKRTEKHVSSPPPSENIKTGSACKRLNMFLRWMVRNDNTKIDFGLWNKLPASKLMCPLDVHSARVARELGLLKRKQNDWKATLELTNNLAKMNPKDPAQYDLALFWIGTKTKKSVKI